MSRESLGPPAKFQHFVERLSVIRAFIEWFFGDLKMKPVRLLHFVMDSGSRTNQTEIYGKIDALSSSGVDILSVSAPGLVSAGDWSSKVYAVSLLLDGDVAVIDRVLFGMET